MKKIKLFGYILFVLVLSIPLLTKAQTSPITCYTFTKNLSVGDSGQDVVALRAILNIDNFDSGYTNGDSIADTNSDYYDDALAAK